MDWLSSATLRASPVIHPACGCGTTPWCRHRKAAGLKEPQGFRNQPNRRNPGLSVAGQARQHVQLSSSAATGLTLESSMKSTAILLVSLMIAVAFAAVAVAGCGAARGATSRGLRSTCSEPVGRGTRRSGRGRDRRHGDFLDRLKFTGLTGKSGESGRHRQEWETRHFREKTGRIPAGLFGWLAAQRAVERNAAGAVPDARFFPGRWSRRWVDCIGRVSQ